MRQLFLAKLPPDKADTLNDILQCRDCALLMMLG